MAEHARVNLISRIDRRLGLCDDYEQAIKDAMIEEDDAIRKTGMLQPGSTAALAIVDAERGFVVVGALRAAAHEQGGGAERASGEGSGHVRRATSAKARLARRPAP